MPRWSPTRQGGGSQCSERRLKVRGDGERRLAEAAPTISSPYALIMAQPGDVDETYWRIMCQDSMGLE